MSLIREDVPRKSPTARLLARLGKVHGQCVHSRRVVVLAAHFAELIPKGNSVLDVGCGDGRIDTVLLDRRPDLTITGVDVAIRPHASIPVRQFDGLHLPFADATFDTVLFSDVLHHTTSPVAILKEAVRVARQHVVMKDHVVQGMFARMTLCFMDYVGNAPHGVVLPNNYFTLAQWDATFRECHLVPRVVKRNLGLYPLWADICFGRGLHFVGIYDIVTQ